MSMTLKTTKNMCCGLSVVLKITTRRSTIDVRKKSDLSRKNRTTGSPGHVRKISDQPRPVYSAVPVWAYLDGHTTAWLPHLAKWLPKDKMTLWINVAFSFDTLWSTHGTIDTYGQEMGERDQNQVTIANQPCSADTLQWPHFDFNEYITCSKELSTNITRA